LTLLYIKTIYKIEILSIGRSIIFASWDGEEFGQLGSTAWLYSHAKELRSRAIVYIDLDNLLQGNDKIHIASSPLLKKVIMEAASSIECPENTALPEMEKSQEDKLNNSRCTLYDTLFSSATTTSDHNNSSTGCISVDGSPFQSILGISSLEVAMKNDYQGKEFCSLLFRHYFVSFSLVSVTLRSAVIHLQPQSYITFTQNWK
jgi:hypothetical protein